MAFLLEGGRSLRDEKSYGDIPSVGGTSGDCTIPPHFFLWLKPSRLANILSSAASPVAAGTGADGGGGEGDTPVAGPPPAPGLRLDPRAPLWLGVPMPPLTSK